MAAEYKLCAECAKGKNIAVEAAKNGHLACLKYALENRHLSFSYDICVAAARYGHLDCLEYCYIYNSDWIYTIKYCIEAAKNGHLDCLKYIMDRGQNSWSETAAFLAAENLELECLLYIINRFWKELYSLPNPSKFKSIVVKIFLIHHKFYEPIHLSIAREICNDAINIPIILGREIYLSIDVARFIREYSYGF
jgi:hypothetical protein